MSCRGDGKTFFTSIFTLSFLFFGRHSPFTLRRFECLLGLYFGVTGSRVNGDRGFPTWFFQPAAQVYNTSVELPSLH